LEVGSGFAMTVARNSSISPKFDLQAYEWLDNVALSKRIQGIRDQLGYRLLILGHHYQRDEVIALSDLRGDSYQLSALAAASTDCRAIAFCGVHFMAVRGDVLAKRPERLLERGGERVRVMLPDLEAGCSMADMADIDQVEECWRQLGQVIDVDEVTPVTYVNSAASLKAFCGRHEGIVCTSANARGVLEWSFDRRPRVLFFPDQHLGRNTAQAMGVPLAEMPVWNPGRELGGNTAADLARSRVVLWQGECSVHQIFQPAHVEHFLKMYPGIKILVHPECMREVVERADVVGSTGKIIRAVREASPGTRWAIGTEVHLVNRLKKEHPEQEIYFLSPVVCMCSTMYRIDLPHLCWTLENLAAGTPVNEIRVDEEIAAGALKSLERMLQVK